MPRGIYALEDEATSWLRDRLVFEDKAKCVEWMEEHVDDKSHPSNPMSGSEHLEHIFTFATTWHEVELYILQKIDEYDTRYPPRPCGPMSPTNVYNVPASSTPGSDSPAAAVAAETGLPTATGRRNSPMDMMHSTRNSQ